MSDSGYILLRDIPSTQVQIDLTLYNLEHGELGFRGVPPGAHYIAVLDGDEMTGFWCHLAVGEVLVKRYDPEDGTFEDAAPVVADEVKRRLEAGTFEEPLLDYGSDETTARDRELWTRLVPNIGWEGFPPELNAEEVLPEVAPEELDDAAYKEWLLQHRDSPFEKALFDTHNGDHDAYLAELEFAFVSWMAANYEESFDRWTELLQGLYNAGMHGIERAEALFPRVIDVVIAQLTCLPEKAFTSDSIFAYGAVDLAEDLMASENEALQLAGRTFADFLEQRDVRA